MRKGEGKQQETCNDVSISLVVFIVVVDVYVVVIVNVVVVVNSSPIGYS